jgi:hypothetical protein
MKSTPSERRINAFSNANKIPSDWEEFPTQSPICGGDDGIPTELDGITFSKVEGRKYQRIRKRHSTTSGI